MVLDELVGHVNLVYLHALVNEEMIQIVSAIAQLNMKMMQIYLLGHSSK